ncbi:P-loop containing nucleoside triphosphate hydrolase protein [Gautieria morchelliformis]|nr:P-loop containing nucleoside triphosphate hydrolase protein [Gautieria morchelliformis]
MSPVTDSPLLSVQNLWCSRSKDQHILSNVSFDVFAGNTLVLTGRSGSGKTTLLKCLSHLNIYQGDILLHGRKPTQYGVPLYRTLVQYVPQRPSLLPGTPRDFVNSVSVFSSRKPTKRQSKDLPVPGDSLGSLHSLANANGNGINPGALFAPMKISEQWGVDEDLWDRPWSKLSGGESQRIALAIAVGIPGAEILLLDEPTSALDAETTALVERSLQSIIKDEASTVKAIIWITHSEEQGRRVGTRFLSLEAGGCLETMEMGLSQSRISRNPSPGLHV